MNRKLVLALALTLLIGMLNVTFNIQPVESDYPWTETIYIRADGSVYPNTAPISSVDNVTYTLTDNIVADSIPSGQSIIAIERDSIVFDGVGCTLQGTENGNGIYLYGRTNVTIKNIHIKNFWHGIYLDSSSHNSLSGNNITNNRVGIAFVYSSSNNSVSGNNITANTDNGIWLGSSSNNSITGNNITNNGLGIGLGSSPNNSVSGNNITGNNEHGIYLSYSSTTSVVENDIINNYNGVFLYYSSNTSVSGNNITNNSHGIYLNCSSSNNSISGNNITNNEYGVFLTYSSNNSVSENYIANNAGDGVCLWTDSLNNILSENNIVNNSEGICVYSGSSNNTVSGNVFVNDGLFVSRSYGSVVEDNIVNGKPLVYLEKFSNIIVGDAAGQVILVKCNNITIQNLNLSNIDTGIQLRQTNNTKITKNNITANSHYGISLWYSSNNTVTGNNIANSHCGIWLYESSNFNSMFHNNFINNTFQLYSSGSVNIWDDGYPSGGNYWSEYAGVDSDHNGIGDSWHEIDENNTDQYPLMGMFSSFNTSLGYHVNVVSNSTLESFEYLESNGTIMICLSGEGFGFCRVCIPHDLMNEPYSVIINGTDVLPYHVDCELFDNGTHRWIYFSYKHSILEVVIVPEFPSLFILPLFMIATLLAVIIYRRKHIA